MSTTNPFGTPQTTTTIYQPPAYPAYLPQTQPETPTRRRASLVLPAIAAGAMLFGVILIGGAAFAALSFVTSVDWTLSPAESDRQLLIDAVQYDWELPLAEQTAVIAQIDRIFAAHKNGQLSDDQCENAVTELLEQPLFSIITARDFEEYYLNEADLSAGQRNAGSRSLQRALRGVLQGSIRQEDFVAALPKIYSFDERFTDEQLDAMSDEQYEELLADEAEPNDDEIAESLVKLQRLADFANIPDEPFEPSFAAEMQQTVDRLLAK